MGCVVGRVAEGEEVVEVGGDGDEGAAVGEGFETVFATREGGWRGEGLFLKGVDGGGRVGKRKGKRW